MIDMLVLRCDFAKVQNPKSVIFTDMIWPDFRLPELEIPVEQSIDRDGEVFNTRHPWEKIPSSYDSMAFKVFDNRYNNLDSFYIEIKASPAKLMLGHNVFGSSDFYDCSMHLMELLCYTYPQIAERLDHETWELHQIDITYSSRAKDNNESKAFINALQNVSYGQTKCRTGYDGTAYFGKKNSRLKKIKVYAKSPEVKETIKKNERQADGHFLNEVYSPELLAFSEGLIRWESSLFSRYFERHNIPTRLKDIYQTNAFAPNKLIQYWQQSTNDLFKSLQGQTMKILNDQEIKSQLRAQFSKTSAKTGKVSTALADTAFRTYFDIRSHGYYVTLESMCRRTFDRHLKMLTEVGLSRAALQNMDGIRDGAQIIPFVRFINVDFANQLPEGYQLPPPKHVYQPKNHLSLVA